MQIILLEDIKNVGKKGERKEVKEGFARNYLLKQNLAVLPGEDAAQKVLAEINQRQELKQEKKHKLVELAKNIEGKTFNFKLKVDKKGHPYGSIGAKEIAKETGIPEKYINAHFKEIGIFELPIDFSQGVVSKVKISIQKQ